MQCFDIISLKNPFVLNKLCTETKGLSEMKTLHDDNNKNVLCPSKACALLLMYDDEEI